MNRILVAIAILLFLPLLGLISQLIPLEGSGVIIGISNDNFSHLWEYLLRSYIIDTFKLMVGVSLGVLMLGVGNAWVVVNYQFPGRKFIEFFLIAPLAVPSYVMAYLFVDLLQYSGPIQTNFRIFLGVDSLWFFPDPRSMMGAIWTFSFCFYPYVYLITRSQFIEHSSRLMEVAESLGYSQKKSFFRLALPIARPAIIAGMALVLMEVLADYGAVSYFGVHTISTGIFKAWLSLGDRVTAIELAFGILLIVIVLFSIEQMSRSNIRYGTHRRSPRLLKQLDGIYAILGVGFTGGTVLIGFVLPFVLLLQSVYENGFQVDPNYLHWLKNSLLISSITAFISVMLAVGFTYAVRAKKDQSWLNKLLGFGYAIPGTVIALGILSFLELFQLAWWISTSIWVLIYANVIRFLASSINSLEAGFSRVTYAMDETAALLGLTKIQILKRVHTPLLKRSIGIAFIFVFVDAMKELPATMLLRPFNFDTLAIKIYQLAADERLIELGLPALTMVILGLIPVMFLSKAIDEKSQQFQA